MMPDDLNEIISTEAGEYNIVVTARSREKWPTELLSSCYAVFFGNDSPHTNDSPATDVCRKG
jgi:hypothetical protein